MPTQYDNNTNIWTMEIPYTIEGLRAAQKLLKQAEKEKQLELKIKEKWKNLHESIKHLHDFIMNNFRISQDSYVYSKDLLETYLPQLPTDMDELTMSSSKFGKLMSLYIESDLNIYKIRRSRTEHKVVYKGIISRSVPLIMNILV